MADQCPNCRSIDTMESMGPEITCSLELIDKNKEKIALETFEMVNSQINVSSRIEICRNCSFIAFFKVS